MSALGREIGFLLQAVRAPALVRASARIEATLQAVAARASAAAASVEADARRIALTLGRCTAAAALSAHAQWALDAGRGAAAAAAVRRFVAHGLDLAIDSDARATAALLDADAGA